MSHTEITTRKVKNLSTKCETLKLLVGVSLSDFGEGKNLLRRKKQQP